MNESVPRYSQHERPGAGLAEEGRKGGRGKYEGMGTNREVKKERVGGRGKGRDGRGMRGRRTRVKGEGEVTQRG